MAIVDEVKEGLDGVVRSAVVKYKNFNPNEAVNNYKKGKKETHSEQKITRPVQKLAIIVPVEEMEVPLCVLEDEKMVQVWNQDKIETEKEYKEILEEKDKEEASQDQEASEQVEVKKEDKTLELAKDDEKGDKKEVKSKIVKEKTDIEKPSVKLKIRKG